MDYRHRLHQEHLERLARMMPRVVEPPPPAPPPEPRAMIEPIPLSDLPTFKRATFEAIKRVVCAYYRITHEQLVGPTKERAVTAARFVAVYLMRELLGVSSTQAAKLVGRSDHSTGLNAHHRVVARAAKDEAFARMLRDLACICRQEIAGLSNPSFELTAPSELDRLRRENTQLRRELRAARREAGDGQHIQRHG